MGDGGGDGGEESDMKCITIAKLRGKGKIDCVYAP